LGDSLSEERFVVFDLDGTLVDTSRDLTDALNRALASLDLPALSRERVVAFVGDGSRKLVDRAVAAVGGPPDMASLVAERFLADYAANVLVATAPYPGIEAALDRLGAQGEVHLCLYSNKPGRHVRELLEGLGWAERFEVVMGGDWGGPRKPAPDGLQHVCNLLGLPCSAGVMVGDGTTDQEAGRAAGLATVAVTWGYRSENQLSGLNPDRLCRSPDHLAEAVIELLASR